MSLPGDQAYQPNGLKPIKALPLVLREFIANQPINEENFNTTWNTVRSGIAEWDFAILQSFFAGLIDQIKKEPVDFLPTLTLLTRLRDWPYDSGQKRKAALLGMLDETIQCVLDIVINQDSDAVTGITWETRHTLNEAQNPDQILVLNVAGFPAEGEQGTGRFIADAAQLGWHRFITYGWQGQRFCGCGLGPRSDGIHIEVYGSSGDYLASGLDGAQIVVHGDAQDQVGQILNAGKLVVHGNVGQTFMYGAKGGEAYVRGNAAGRPLINAVGYPRVVINGTCLDYLAESFMAGDPLNGGGFVILNGVSIDSHGEIHNLEEPYPGGNLFSLASGGAIYIRDPYHKVEENQLNGGHFTPLTDADWALIQPYLEENARLFDIPVERLLTVDGHLAAPNQVYRKVSAVKLSVLA